MCVRGIRFEGQQLLFLTNLFGENCMEKLAADTNWSHKYTCQDTSSDRHRVCRNKSLVYMCWELKNNLFAEPLKGQQSRRRMGSRAAEHMAKTPTQVLVGAAWNRNVPQCLQCFAGSQAALPLLLDTVLLCCKNLESGFCIQ